MPITSTNDIKKIRETYDKIETNVQSLHSLDIDTSQYSPVLISIVMWKLPEGIKLEISRSMPISCKWDVVELWAALLKEIESREMCSFMNYSRKNSEYRGFREFDGFTCAALFSGSNPVLQINIPLSVTMNKKRKKPLVKLNFRQLQ